MPKTENYFVRPLEKSDVVTITRWLEDLEDLSLFDRCARIPLNLEASEKVWADAFSSDVAAGKYWFAIEDGQSEPIGIVGLENVNHINGDAVLAVCISGQLRKKGIGIRTAALIMDVAFLQLGLNRLTSYYRADNDASRHLIERVGFQQEGCMRQAWFTNGRHVDMMTVGILRQEWMERKDTLARELDKKTVVKFGRHPSQAWTWPP